MQKHGWTGRLLRVDLTTGRIAREEIQPEILHAYLGGRGLGVRLLRDFYRLDPFSPDMPLVYAAGPLCGTGAPTTSRLSIVSRSPLTGAISDCSIGSRFAWRMKAAGLDAIFITGRSDRPVILKIRGEEASIEPADTLWGKTVPQTIADLAAYGSVSCIGPAGENGVLYANIVADDFPSTGRGGLGAVMGAKGLKAVVADGNNSVSVANPERFEHAGHDLMRLFRASPVIFGELGLAEFGTPAFVDLMRQRMMEPAWNFRSASFPESSSYSGPAIRSHYKPENHGCYGCPVNCRKMTAEGEELPDYDALSHFGALNGISDLPSIVRANSVCNDLGLDPISAGATIAAWGEATGRFPDAGELPAILKGIAFRSGEAAQLADGSRRMAERLGKTGIAMTVKSLELPACDPRGAYGMALSYCTSNRGACHLSAFPISHEVLRKPVPTDRFSFSGKARMNVNSENARAVTDSIAACGLTLLGATLEEYAELLSAATGMEYTPKSLNDTGERIFLAERFYNCANGFNVYDDILPERFFTEPGTVAEGADIAPIDKKRFKEELQKYYRIRGLQPDGTFGDPEFLGRQP